MTLLFSLIITSSTALSGRMCTVLINIELELFFLIFFLEMVIEHSKNKKIKNLYIMQFLVMYRDFFLLL